LQIPKPNEVKFREKKLLDIFIYANKEKPNNSNLEAMEDQKNTDTCFGK